MYKEIQYLSPASKRSSRERKFLRARELLLTKKKNARSVLYKWMRIARFPRENSLGVRIPHVSLFLSGPRPPEVVSSLISTSIDQWPSDQFFLLLLLSSPMKLSQPSPLIKSQRRCTIYSFPIFAVYGELLVSRAVEMAEGDAVLLCRCREYISRFIIYCKVYKAPLRNARRGSNATRVAQPRQQRARGTRTGCDDVWGNRARTFEGNMCNARAPTTTRHGVSNLFDV